MLVITKYLLSIMTNWIYLSKNGQDPYINMLAQADGQPARDTESQWDTDSKAGLVMRGILKYKIMQQCWANSRPFRYVDTGYFGNHATRTNPQGWKHWHRIVPNNLQHQEILSRPPDRWLRHGLALQPRRSGSHVLIAAPDEKPCRIYNTSLEQWLNDTVRTVAQHTDRPIVIRQRAAQPSQRRSNPFITDLINAHAVIVFNSNAATEAVIQGVPVYVMAPCHAAAAVANRNLQTIEQPWWPDDDLRWRWVCHLAYGQFHITEMQNGQAKKILDHTMEQQGALWNSQ